MATKFYKQTLEEYARQLATKKIIRLAYVTRVTIYKGSPEQARRLISRNKKLAILK